LEETVAYMCDDPASGWGLRSVQAADQAILTAYFGSLAEPLSDYTFSQVYTWRNSLRIFWTTLRGHLCVFANGDALTLLMPPIGDGDSRRALAAAFELMDDYNAAHGRLGQSRVEYVSDELLNRCGRQGLIVEPMAADYLYDVRRMIDLPGGDLASKRQAKNRFMRTYPHQVEPYDPALHLRECQQLLDSWRLRQEAEHGRESQINLLKRRKESVAAQTTLASAMELGMRGLVVRVQSGQDWPIRGFTFGEFLGRDQSSVTIEKTDLEIKGLAQFIFSEFCRRAWAERPLVNVGDDWGLETLAWTKKSYRPVKMLQKYLLRQQAAVAVPVAAPAPAAQIGIRPAAKTDLPAAAELETACFTSYRLSKRQLQYLHLRQRRSAIFLVAEEQGRLVGQGIALLRQHRRGLSGRIYSLAVHPQRRGRKIGLRLLQALIGELSARGTRRIYLEVEAQNLAAVSLYDQCGFRHIGLLPHYYGPGQPAVHMMCQTPAPQPLSDSPPVGYNQLPCPTDLSNFRPAPACSV
jgi:uncharacterized protein